MKHPDFEHGFAELEPRDQKTFDIILERFRISVIGCDPHTKYHS
jgi:hypothetical protein